MITYADEVDTYGDEEREPSALSDTVVALPNLLEKQLIVTDVRDVDVLELNLMLTNIDA